MVKSEVAKLLAVIAAAYSRFQVDELKQNVWFEMLGDVDYKIAQMAVKKLMLESPFPPTIADIRKQIAEITTPEKYKISAADAWGEIEQAISKYGYYQQSEALDSMSSITRKTVDLIGFRQICLCEEPGVVRGQFLRMFEQVANKEKQNALLPENLKKQIDAIAARQNLRLVEGGSK